jgi:hypothetical protein
MSTESAAFYDPLYSFKDYRAAARDLHAVFDEVAPDSN